MAVTTSAPSTRRPTAPPTAAPVARRRLPLLALGVVSLLTGLWGGLLLLGLPVPSLRASATADHGLLMTLGFLGTVISLERAVALGRNWAFTAPAAAGTGGLAVLVGAPALVGQLLLCLASVVLVVVYVAVQRIQPALHLLVMTGGAICWYVATLLWLGGWSVPRLVPWLVGFLVLTILGERLELARVALLTPASVRHFVAGATAFGVGLLLSTASGDAATLGVRLGGVGLAALALWGTRHDVARRTVKVPGVTRFMAVCLLAGYVWLLATGVTWLVVGDLGRSIATYDAALHAVFLGFVMSMIFGHAPVIVPAVLRMRLPFQKGFYAHVVLLHTSLLVRLVGGDALHSRMAWQVGGVGNEIAVLLFLAASAAAVVSARRRPAPTTASRS
jgi:hypothetical protein